MKIFDSHFHIIDHRFPLVRNQGYLPGEFTCEDYRQWMNNLDVVGGCIVSGSYQGYDQEYLLHALENLGPTFVGVTRLPLRLPRPMILALALLWLMAASDNARGQQVMSYEDYQLIDHDEPYVVRSADHAFLHAPAGGAGLPPKMSASGPHRVLPRTCIPLVSKMIWIDFGLSSLRSC